MSNENEIDITIHCWVNIIKYLINVDCSAKDDGDLIQHKLFQVFQIYSRKAILLKIIFDFLSHLNIK